MRLIPSVPFPSRPAKYLLGLVMLLAMVAAALGGAAQAGQVSASSTSLTFTPVADAYVSQPLPPPISAAMLPCAWTDLR